MDYSVFFINRSSASVDTFATPQQLDYVIDSQIIHTAFDKYPSDPDQKIRHLPCVTWAASYPDGRSKQAQFEPTGLLPLDIDHVSQKVGVTPREAYDRFIAPRLDQLHLALVHETISRDGLRVVAAMQPEWGSTLTEQQMTFMDLIPELLPALDRSCVGQFERLFSLAPRECIIYRDDSVIFSD